ncbi:MAG: hypothetical protein ACK4VX_06550 [Polaromonas sp.]
MPYVDTIRINQIFVIESLRPDDKKSARDMVFDVNLEIASTPMRATFELCAGVQAFKELIHGLTVRTASDEVLPLLHIECHGHQDDGLVFSDSSTLSWPEMWDVLRPLNVVMGNRLVVVLATCVSFGAITLVPLSSPAACYFLIAPTEKIYPDELYSAFKEFYCRLASGDAANAMESLTIRRYQEGGMGSMAAGEWFSRLMDNYLREHGSTKGLKASALRLAMLAKDDGMANLNMRYWKSFVKNTLSQRLHQYFDVFFMLDKFPSSRVRFSKEQDKLERRLEEQGYRSASLA